MSCLADGYHDYADFQTSASLQFRMLIPCILHELKLPTSPLAFPGFLMIGFMISNG